MRRRDREMDREFGLKIIDQAEYGVLSLVSLDGEPYGMPLSIVRDGNTLYFHSAKDGKKVKALAKNVMISIAFVGAVAVPEPYTKEELDEIAKDESKVALLLSKVFTTEFQSAIVMGKTKLVTSENDKIKALRLICEKYTPTKMDYFPAAIKAGLKKTNIYAIEIDEIKAKEKSIAKRGMKG